MIEDGFEKEAQSVMEFRNYNSLKTVGFNEWFDYFDGKISKEAAIEKIKQHTRNYAKRQLTWFRKMENVKFINKNAFEEIVDKLAI